MEKKIKAAKAFVECKIKAQKSITICFHPNCNEPSINSHILQKNGILSVIADNGHVITLKINPFKESKHSFERTGINEAFSFNCFCNKHDSDLFKSIEKENIDFEDYKSLILFTLRTIYNEIFRKLVNIKMNECLIKNYSEIFNIQELKKRNYQEKLGLTDLEKIEKIIWNDLDNETESFIFKTREITKKDVCLSSFYTYDTSEEIKNYYYSTGKNKESLIEIFVNLFPYKSNSIFMIGYQKKYEPEVKGYVNSFFSDNEKRLERKITNLMMFLCETWVISSKLFDKQIKGHENNFSYASAFSLQNYNERQFFDINIFKDDFLRKFEYFKKTHPIMRIYNP